MDSSSKNRVFIAVAIFLLIAITSAVYGHVIHHQFINLDDPLYVTENSQIREGLSRQGIVWAFTSMHASNWHPLTWISHMLDVHFFGLYAGAHHLISVLFHIANSLLLFMLFLKMTNDFWPALFVAFVFALHPLHTESVAWVSEKKDVLSTFFWLLSMWSYISYAKTPEWKKYVLTLMLFALGLMSKPMVVTLPLILMLIDIWPLKRLSLEAADLVPPVINVATSKSSSRIKPSKKKAESRLNIRLLLIGEKIPFLLLAFISGIITLYAQQKTISGAASVSLVTRIENALVSYALYIVKTIIPLNLSVFYPWRETIPIWQGLSAVLVITGITVLVLYKRRQYPFLAVGWFWYIVTLVPVIGIIQVGSQAMADRYTYIPMIGLLILLGWGVPVLFPKRKPYTASLKAAGIIAVAICIPLTFSQVCLWESDVPLWEHAIHLNPDNDLAHNNLGTALEKSGQHDKAIAHYQEAIRIDPGRSLPYRNLGNIFLEMKDPDKAIIYYRKAIAINPDQPEVHYNMGLILADQKNYDEAINALKRAVRINPDYKKAYFNLAIILADLKRNRDAVSNLKEVIRIDPQYVPAYVILGFLFAEDGDKKQAILYLGQALQIDPNDQAALNLLKKAQNQP